MNDSAATQVLNMPVDQLPTPVSPSREGEIALPKISENPEKLIPRHQNKMIAETTSDMFMKGLMCE